MTVGHAKESGGVGAPTIGGLLGVMNNMSAFGTLVNKQVMDTIDQKIEFLTIDEILQGKQLYYTALESEASIVSD